MRFETRIYDRVLYAIGGKKERKERKQEKEREKRDVRSNEKLLGDATSRFTLFPVFSLLRIYTLGILRSRRSRSASGASSSSLLGVSSSCLFSTRQRTPLRSEITDSEAIRAKLLAKKGDQVRVATGNSKKYHRP